VELSALSFDSFNTLEGAPDVRYDEVLRFLCGSVWNLKRYLDELRLQRVNCEQNFYLFQPYPSTSGYSLFSYKFCMDLPLSSINRFSVCFVCVFSGVCLPFVMCFDYTSSNVEGVLWWRQLSSGYGRQLRVYLYWNALKCFGFARRGGGSY
jgi:hypothetical protein